MEEYGAGSKTQCGVRGSVSKVGTSGRICVEPGRGRPGEMRKTRGRQTGKGRRPGGRAGNTGRDLREVVSGEDRGFGGRNGGACRQGTYRQAPSPREEQVVPRRPSGDRC